jgi:hypothetical protein
VFVSLGPVFVSLGPVFVSLGPVFVSLGPVFVSLGSVFISLGSVFVSLGSVFVSLGSMVVCGSLFTVSVMPAMIGNLAAIDLMRGLRLQMRPVAVGINLEGANTPKAQSKTNGGNQHGQNPRDRLIESYFCHSKAPPCVNVYSELILPCPPDNGQ